VVLARYTQTIQIEAMLVQIQYLAQSLQPGVAVVVVQIRQETPNLQVEAVGLVVAVVVEMMEATQPVEQEPLTKDLLVERVLPPECY
jgi:hypothetical protein